jgi:hypothetical protein
MRIAIIAGLGLACPLLVSAAPGCPKDVPKGLSAVAVGGHVAVSGLAMAINQVQGGESAATVLTRTAAEWTQAGHIIRRGKTHGWEVLSAMGDKCLVTLQLMDRKGSFGYLARSVPATGAAPSTRALGVPLPPDARLASSVASEDDGRKGLVVTASSAQTMDALNRYFIEQLSDHKWSTPRSHKIVNRKTGVDTLFLSARRERKQVEIVMWSERGTQIVMTVAESL